MPVLRAFVLLCALGVFSTGCGAPQQQQAAAPPPPVEAASPPPAAFTVAGAYPLPGEPLEDRIVVYFTEPIAPDGAQVSLEPEAPIASTATGERHIALTLDTGTLAPGVYTLRFGEGLRSVSGATLRAPETPLTFTAADNRPTLASGLLLDSQTDGAVSLLLNFNRAMDAVTAQSFISVTDATGAAVAVIATESDKADALTLRIPAGVALPLTATVRAGAPAANGLATEADAAFSYPPDSIAVQEVSLGDSDTGTLQLLWSMTHDIDLSELRARLTATDAAGEPIATDIQPGDSGNRFTVALPSSAAQPLMLTLQQGLPAPGGAVLIHDFSVTYPSGPLSITSASLNSTGGTDQLVLSSSEPVRWEKALPFISVSEADTGKLVTLGGTYTQDSEVTLDVFGLGSDANFLNVAIKPGIAGVQLGVLQDAFETQLERSATPFEVDYADWRARGKDGMSLYLNLNQRVDVTSLRDAIRFEPPVADISVVPAWSNSYKVHGGFAAETEYTMTFAARVKTPDGRSILDNDYEYPLEPTPEGAPSAGFGFEDKIFFPRRTQGVLPLIARDTDTVGVRVSQLFPSNIAGAIYDLEEGKTWGDFEGDWAKLITEQSIPVRGAEGKSVTVPLNLNETLPEGARGVFGIALDPQPYDYGTKIVVWTDIGLMAHWLDDELALFAHDLFTAAPLAGAKVTLWSSKHQIMGEVNTDERGIARMSGLDTALGQPMVAVCETDSDYTFLRLTARGDDPVPTNEGMPAYDRDGYDAFLYADRNLYRPGEVVHARWIARTNYGDALGGVPLQLIVSNPQGAEVSKTAVELSALGTGGFDLQTDSSWPTGKYTFEIGAPDATPSGTLTVNVEDFVPNRLKTAVALPEGPWRAKTDYTIEVKAEQLFGGPAANQVAKAAVILRKGEFQPEAWPGYRFTNDTDFAAEVVPLGEKTTDGAGVASFTYTFPGSAKTTFPILATVRGEVAEAGARPVNDTKDVLLLPAEPLLGVALSSGAEGGLDAAIAAVDAQGAAAAVGTVTVVLEREDWSYYVRRYADRNEPSFTKSFEIIETREVALTDGRGAASFALSEYGWGYHRVRVESAETPMTASASFYKMWRGIEVADAPRPSLIKLTLDKPAYHPGDTAELRIESPFDGQAVVVLQGDTFQQVLTVEVKDSVGAASFAIEPAMHPNVWAGVTVVHRAPEDRQQVYPYSSFAMVNLPVPDPTRQLAVSLPDAPEEMRPGNRLELTIETKGSDGAPRGAEVTVAAVDEGIHGILDYADPDPWNHFQRFRSPDHRRAHYYDRVAYDFDAAAIGGDLASRLAKRGATIGENWINPVALWTGAVQTDETGRAVVGFDVPEFTGQLRIVAVAADIYATGVASENVFVRRPFMLQTSMPRFALPGDRFEARATVFNTTANVAAATVRWNASGTLVSPPGEAQLSVAANANTGTLAAFDSGPNAGQGLIAWTLDVEGAPEDAVVQSAPIPVRPPAAYESRHELAAVAPGETRVFKNDAFADDGNAALSVTVGADPALRVYNGLKYLIAYPHGCVEQTVSQCFPLYLLRKSTALMESTLGEERRIDFYLKRGIGRLISMQTASGGLGYWPGAREPDRYGSVYALHFLSLVQLDRELEVPEAAYARLREYVRRVSQETSDSSQSGLYLRAYAYFALALGGDQEALDQIGRYDALTLPEPARYLLAAVVAMQTGDESRAREYLATMPMQPYDTFERGGTLNSATRAASVKLLALLRMGAPDEQLAPLVTQLSAALDAPRYTNTQEIAFASAALGSYLSRLAEQGAAQGVVRGPEGERAFAGRELFTLTHEGAGGEYTVENTGSAVVYVSAVASGMPVSPVTEAVSEGGMTLARSITALDGSVPEGSFKQGESYIIALELNAQAGLENVVISDLLPAGFEIENPRLDANVQAAAGVKDQSAPSYLDIRDDRLVLAFNRLPSNTTRYSYVVRAVTPGAYTHPGSVAECMYDPAFRATTVAGTIEVTTE
jgi:uncharacterized protein YfaS (alpha-2-macroglobulin family)